MANKGISTPEWVQEKVNKRMDVARKMYRNLPLEVRQLVTENQYVAQYLVNQPPITWSSTYAEN